MAEEDFLRETPFPENNKILLVEEKRIHVNENFLKSISPVFKAMFDCEFLEKRNNEIPLPGKKFEDVVLFLQCSYPFIGKTVTVENVLRILPLAHEYQTDLQDVCEDSIVERCYNSVQTLKILDPDTVVDYLISTEAYLPRALEMCVQVAKYLHSEKLESIEIYSSLTLETRYRIVNARIKMFEDIWRKSSKLWLSKDSSEKNKFLINCGN